MDEAVQFIQHEIAKRQAEIGALQLALNALTGPKAEPPGAKFKRWMNSVDAKKSTSEANESGTFTVNGVDFELGPKTFPLAKAIGEAEDCVPTAQLATMFGGNQQYVRVAVSVLNKRLKAAGAQIVHFRGEGYRLQNIEEDE